MPKGVYDRSRLRQSAPGEPRPAIARDSNWGKRGRRIKGEINYYDLIPVNEIPEDASYEWKRMVVTGKEETQYLTVLHENGWSPVPHSRHPYMPKLGDNIIHEGMILMERPIELTEEARDEDKKAHDQQMRHGRESVKQTQQGQLERRDLGTRVGNETVTIVPDDDKYVHGE